MINIEVEKSNTESSTSLIRRFTRRVQESGVLTRVRSLRYHGRPKSKYIKKKQTLKASARRAEVQQLIKLGKIQEQKGYRRRRR